MKKRKNGPVIHRKFIDEAHRTAFDQGRISMEDATIVFVPNPYLDLLTEYRVSQALKIAKHYIYPEFLHDEAKAFLIVDTDTGDTAIRKYLYTEVLSGLIGNHKYNVYVTDLNVL